MQKLQLAQAALKRGSICHWQQSFGPHFAVILNLEWPPFDDVVLFVIMTSRTGKFPSSLDDQIIRTGPNEYSFLTVATIIDFRQVHQARLSAIVNQPQFAVKGNLTQSHVDQADRILRASVTVEQAILDRVVK